MNGAGGRRLSMNSLKWNQALWRKHKLIAILVSRFQVLSVAFFAHVGKSLSFSSLSHRVKVQKLFYYIWDSLSIRWYIFWLNTSIAGVLKTWPCKPDVYLNPTFEKITTTTTITTLLWLAYLQFYRNIYTLSFKIRFTVFHFPGVLTMGLKKDL